MTARRVAVIALLGTALGFTLARLGFTDFGEVHRMFTFGLARGGPGADDLRLLLAFGGAVAFGAVGFFLLARRDALPARPVQRGTVVGGLLFGAGWALSGSCPATAFVQLGEGRGIAAVGVAGLVAGLWLGRRVAARLGWTTEGCA